MKRKIFQWLLVCLCTISVQAQQPKNNNADSVRISGQLKGYKPGIPGSYLSVAFWENHIYGNYHVNSIRLKITPDKNGKFSFTLPAIDHVGRIFINYRAADLLICNFQLVEPGDNIYISVVLAPDDTKQSIVKFSGRGAAKYIAGADTAIDIYKDYSSLSNREKDIDKSLNSADSMVQRKLKVLEAYRTKLSKDVYEIMKVDLYAQIHNYVVALTNIYLSQDNIDKKQKLDLQEGLKNLVKKVKRNSTSEKYLVLSREYISLLYEISKLELIFENSGSKFSFKDLYTSIKGNYTGVVREKILTHCIYNSWDMGTFFGGINNTDDYTDCLRDALQLVTTPYLRLAIENRLTTRGKGANAFNFSLPKDSSQKVVKLSDLKGKVVLLDMWGYVCTGCYMFSQAFHEKIYPSFKDNSDFVVVSIMLDETANKDHYMKRLRGEGNYTSPEYINLYAGKDIAMQKRIGEHYNIDAVPFLLLVDKNGKIFSSTLPFFTDTKSEKIDELKKIIQQALDAPAIN